MEHDLATKRTGDKGEPGRAVEPAEYDAATKRAAAVVAAVASFLTPFMGSSINVALPLISEEFVLSAVLMSWVPVSFILSASMFLVPCGRLADIYGRKKIFFWGTVVYTLFSLLSAVASSGVMLIAFRFLQGIGGAMIFGTGVAILTSVFPPQERGKALGINVAAVYTGLSLGPFAGGFLTHLFGWRSIFLANVPLGLLVMLLVWLKLKGEWAEARGEAFDIWGAVIYSLALVATIYGFSVLPGGTGMLLVALGIAGIAGFIAWESRAQNPVLDVSLFRHNRVFAFSSLAALIHYCATFAVAFLMSLYLQYIKGLTPEGAGTVLAAQPVVMALFSPFAGRLSDRIEPRVVASLGMSLTVVGLLVLVFLGSETPFGIIVAGLVLLGIGFALFSSPNTNAIMSAVHRRFYGVAAGTAGTMRMLGQMLSMGIVMMLFALLLGQARVTPQNYGLFLTGMKISLAIFAVLCVGGIFASLARGRLR
ncbi:MAG: MFS transporter [Desulfotomaculales bacterium]